MSMTVVLAPSIAEPRRLPRAVGQSAALQRMRTVSLVCCRPGCHALVDYKAARRQAKQAGRKTFASGDGCGGHQCSIDHRPARFAKRQREHAERLERGERLLARWPRDLADREVWAYPEEVARGAAEAAREALI